MSKEEFIRQRDAYRVQEDDKMEQIQRLRTEKDQIFLPVRKDADNLQTVVSAAEEAGDVMHLSQNITPKRLQKRKTGICRTFTAMKENPAHRCGNVMRLNA